MTRKRLKNVNVVKTDDNDKQIDNIIELHLNEKKEKKYIHII